MQYAYAFAWNFSFQFVKKIKYFLKIVVFAYHRSLVKSQQWKY